MFEAQANETVLVRTPTLVSAEILVTIRGDVHVAVKEVCFRATLHDTQHYLFWMLSMHIVCGFGSDL